MESFLVIVIQFILEAFLNIFTAFPWPLFYRGENEESNTFYRGCFSFFCGLLIGMFSLYFFPKSFVSIFYLRIANLILSPVLLGFLSKAIAEFIHRRKDDVWPKRHFWYAFWSCLGYAALRFVFTQR